MVKLNKETRDCLLEIYNSKNISLHVSDLFQIIGDLQKIKQQFLELWDKDWVKLEINKLEEEIRNNTKTEISDEEKKKYEKIILSSYKWYRKNVKSSCRILYTGYKKNI